MAKAQKFSPVIWGPGGTARVIAPGGLVNQLSAVSVNNAASPYTITVSDSFINVDGTSGVTLTPLATSRQVYTVRKSDSTFGVITITGVTTLNTQGEVVSYYHNGTGYVILNRYIPSTGTAWTPTFTGLGTVVLSKAYWYRIGNRMRGVITGTAGTVTAADVSFTIPTGIVFDTTEVNATIGCIVGMATLNRAASNGTANFTPIAAIDGATGILSLVNTGDGATRNLDAVQGSTVYASSSTFSYEFEVAIEGWEG